MQPHIFPHTCIPFKVARECEALRAFVVIDVVDPSHDVCVFPEFAAWLRFFHGAVICSNPLGIRVPSNVAQGLRGHDGISRARLRRSP
jgi:hypothetical protein